MPTAVAPTPRPIEQAQVVWQRAVELGQPPAERARMAAVLDVLRAADHDSSTVAHALALGRTQLRGDADNAGIRDGVSTLARAAAFLGVKPRLNDAAMLEVLQ